MTFRGTGPATRPTGFPMGPALLLVLLTACGSPGRDEREGAAAVPEAAADATADHRNASSNSMAAAELDQLAVNEEYGIRAFFPRDAVVCVARSWEHPVGLYAFFGEPRECGHPFDEPVPRYVGIYAGYNAFFATSARDHLPCPDGPPPAGVSLDLRDLVLPGLVSHTCASVKDGRTVVAVSALGGGPFSEVESEPSTELILYHALLSTRAEHLSEDLAYFRRFVRLLQFVPVE